MKHNFVYKLGLIPTKKLNKCFVPTGIESSEDIVALEKTMVKRVRDLFKLYKKVMPQ